jgi:hypothetical protein
LPVVQIAKVTYTASLHRQEKRKTEMKTTTQRDPTEKHKTWLD